MKNYTHNLKAMVLAGAMMLATVGAYAQQEVSPDHYDDAATVAQKSRPAAPKKQLVATRKSVNGKRSTLAKVNKSDRQVEIAGK